jgi:hypothetical protein
LPSAIRQAKVNRKIWVFSRRDIKNRYYQFRAYPCFKDVNLYSFYAPYYSGGSVAGCMVLCLAEMHIFFASDSRITLFCAYRYFI